MTNKAYIVANEEQEHEVLNDLEQECLLWHSGEYPTEFMPSKRYNVIFPYAIFVYYNTVYWNMLSELEDEEIVFDGRKEGQMSDKYVVSQ